MITIVGIILLVLPFVGVCLYPNIKEGVLKILGYTVLFHIIVSVGTQVLHVFTYPAIFLLHLLYALFWVLLIYQKKKKNIVFRGNWIVVGALGLIAFQLISVHFFYSGKVQSIRGQERVTESSSSYPFFSDEWIAVSLANYSIAEGRLPLVNPLRHNIFFSNILVTFSSMIAEVALLLGLQLLTSYVWLSICFGIIFCLSVYTLLRTYNVERYSAATAILALPYIANSGNLPALWSFLPCSVGLFCFVWQLVAHQLDHDRWAVVFGICALIWYPPIIVFVVPVLLVTIIRKRKIGMVAVWSIAVLVVGIIVMKATHLTVIDVIGLVIRPALDTGIVSYPLWQVLPWVVALVSIVGICRVIKQKYYTLLTALIVGIGYWCIYIQVHNVIIIEYPRIVFITSVLLIATAGIGLQWIISQQFQKWIYFIVMGLVFLGICTGSYTRRESWRALTLTTQDQKGRAQIYEPAAAVNRYLTADDLRLFNGITEQNFIAPPWKGLVVGVATHNFPLETKASTITMQVLRYSDFIRSGCTEKRTLAHRFSMTYAYTEAFECPGFDIVGSSSEGLVLYKVQ